MFSGCIGRDQWHEMGQLLQLILHKIYEEFFNGKLPFLCSVISESYSKEKSG